MLLRPRFEEVVVRQMLDEVARGEDVVCRPRLVVGVLHKRCRPATSKHNAVDVSRRSARVLRGL